MRKRFKSAPPKKNSESDEPILGVVIPEIKGYSFKAVSKKIRKTFPLLTDAKLQENDLVFVKIDRLGRAHLVKKVDRYNEADSPVKISIYERDIPHVFPEDVLKSADKLKEATLENRTDLRNIPLVTIDGSDAKDFDDAVWAEADPSPKNKGGWHLLVAIADVSHYVKIDSALDKEALKRGNSVYFPRFVVPMLPERLSNDLCSLKPNVDRACLAVHMWINKDGELINHQFVRGLMKSHARLTYEEIQEAREDYASLHNDDIKKQIIPSLYGAFKCLEEARKNRGTLEFDLPEYQINLGEQHKVKSVELRERLDSHRLIEEFMILANVAAAKTLTKRKAMAMYRIHSTPPPSNLENLLNFLKQVGMHVKPPSVVTPAFFQTILARVSGKSFEHIVSILVLRSQSQAVYSPNLEAEDAYGHFGLALKLYAHFTSPIRRYADLLVHRSLIQELGLGDKMSYSPEQFEEIGQHISQTERRAALAERDTKDRYLAEYCSQKTDQIFDARISGVGRFGIFATIKEFGAEGLIPFRNLPNDRWIFDEPKQMLIGKNTRKVLKLGDTIKIKIVDSSELSGSLKLKIIDGKKPQKSQKDQKFVKKKHKSKRKASNKRKKQGRVSDGVRKSKKTSRH